MTLAESARGRSEHSRSRFQGKTVLITGGGNGMGRSHARAFAAEGADVIVADLQADDARAVAGELNRAQSLELDVTSESAWDAAARDLGAIDVLVNNAGVVIEGAIGDVTLASFDKVWEVNVRGALLGMRAFVPAMTRRGSGAIVNIGSISAVTGHRGSVAYGASKWGLRGLSRSVALDVAGTGVRVNTVHPGFVRTQMTANVDRAVVSKLSIRRFAEPHEISAAVLFLASDDASYCTGSDLVVDGGFTA